MHIVFLASDFSARGSGGIGTYIATIADGLARRGHDVKVISPRARAANGALFTTVELGVQVGHADRRPQLASAFCEAVKQIHARNPVTVIEATDYGIEGWRTATDSELARAGVPTVVRLHTPDSLVCELNGEVRLADSTAVHAVEGEYFRQASFLSAPSRAMARETQRRWGVPTATIRVLPNPISDLGHAPATTMRSRRRRVVFFGRLERRKGAHVMATAMQLLLPSHPDVEVEFIGADTRIAGGSMGMALRTLLEPWQDRVQFSGHLSPEPRRAALLNADVVCLPSLWENFPYACVEAIALRRPVIATSGSGFDEIVDQSVNGLLVPPSDESALASGILKILSDPDAFRPSLDSTRHLAVENLVPEFETFYKQVAA